MCVAFQHFCGAKSERFPVARAVTCHLRNAFSEFQCSSSKLHQERTAMTMKTFVRGVRAFLHCETRVFPSVLMTHITFRTWYCTNRTVSKLRTICHPGAAAPYERRCSASQHTCDVRHAGASYAHMYATDVEMTHVDAATQRLCQTTYVVTQTTHTLTLHTY